MNDREFLIIVITTNYAVCHSSGYQPLSPNSTGEPACPCGAFNLYFLYSLCLFLADRFEQPIALRVRRLPPSKLLCQLHLHANL